MPELTDNVNWLAVIIGFVLAFALGWLWYSPKLFGRKWAEGVGLDHDEHGQPARPVEIRPPGADGGGALRA